jgi:hypothetical protein
VTDPVRYRRAPGHAWRRWRGTALVMGPALEPVALAGAAAAVWHALEVPRTTGELDALAASAAGAPARAGADGVVASVADALVELEALGLIVVEAVA